MSNYGINPICCIYYAIISNQRMENYGAYYGAYCQHAMIVAVMLRGNDGFDCSILLLINQN